MELIPETMLFLGLTLSSSVNEFQYLIRNRVDTSGLMDLQNHDDLDLSLGKKKGQKMMHTPHQLAIPLLHDVFTSEILLDQSFITITSSQAINNLSKPSQPSIARIQYSVWLKCSNGIKL